MSAPAERNLTYRQLRAPARQGSYTVGQLVALAVSGLLAVVVAAGLVRLGAPVGLALSGGVLLAGSVPMAALALTVAAVVVSGSDLARRTPPGR